MLRHNRKIKVGDRIVVSRRPEKVVVERLEYEADGRVKMILDWGPHGKSRVYEDDLGKTWEYQDTVN